MALRSRPVKPVVAGVSFLVPSMLSAEADAGGPAVALARFCERGRLDFVFVPSWEPWAVDATRALSDLGVAVMWVVGGVLWPALESGGVMQGLRASSTDPDTLAPDMDAALEIAVESLARGLALGVDAVVVGEDLAGADGPLVSPDFALDAVLPRLNRLAAEAADGGVPAVLHSDGDVRVLLGGIRRAGFSALHAGGVRPEQFERLFWHARTSGLAVLGGVSAAECEAGGPTAVRAGTRAGILAEAGGLLIADDGGLATGTQLGGLFAAISAARGDSSGP